ncbi:MAG TPA: hypothetical protein VK524_02280, partial [Polyangiaceae bacterium]|nr:hypothetical protein [Polyangiaceae bacterium]
GALAGGASPGTGGEIIGYTGGHTIPSLAEYQAWVDACVAMEDCAPMPGKSEHLYRAKTKSGTAILDLIGTDHLPAVGAPTETAIYARAWAF